MTCPSQELFTLLLHYNAFGTGERTELALGSRSPEEAAAWHAALVTASREAADVAAAPQGTEAGEDASLTPRCGGEDPSDSGSKRKGTERKATLGHVPPEMRYLRDLALQGPAPRVTSCVGEEAAGEEGPSVLPGGAETWRLAALENGLRFFEDGSGAAGSGSGWAAPCTKVAGRVRAPADVLFKLVMDLGPTRGEWDPTFDRGAVLERLDGHSEVIHTRLRPLRLAASALPSRPRDLVLTRYWRREADGTYMVLLRSTEHPACPPARGCVRAEVASGCIIITPLAGRGATGDSLVMHLLETSPRGWMLPFTGLPRAFQHALLLTVAGMRDFFEQLSETASAAFQTGLLDPLRSLEGGSDGEEEAEEEEADGSGASYAAQQPPQPPSPLQPGGLPGSPAASPGGLARRATSGSQERSSSLAPAPPVTACMPAAPFPGLPLGGGGALGYGAWPPPKGGRSVNCWCVPYAHRFVVRSASYLADGVKSPAGPPLFAFVASDWLVDERDRIDHICGRPGGTCQRSLLAHTAPDTHVFCVNLQVPGAKPYSIIFYFAAPGPPPRDSPLGKFWHGDAAYRAPRFKLIPAITEGAWVVQRSVGTKPLIVGNALKTTYHGGGASRYLEVDVDIGSSSVANSVTRFVVAYLKTLVIDLGFLVESKSEAELPEQLIGIIRVAHLDPDLATQAPPPEMK